MSSETPADAENSLTLQRLQAAFDQVRLPEGSGPPLDADNLNLLERLVDRQLRPEYAASVYRLIAAFPEWNAAYTSLLLQQPLPPDEPDVGDAERSLMPL